MYHKQRVPKTHLLTKNVQPDSVSVFNVKKVLKLLSLVLITTITFSLKKVAYLQLNFLNWSYKMNIFKLVWLRPNLCFCKRCTKEECFFLFFDIMNEVILEKMFLSCLFGGKIMERKIVTTIYSEWLIVERDYFIRSFLRPYKCRLI